MGIKLQRVEMKTFLLLTVIVAIISSSPFFAEPNLDSLDGRPYELFKVSPIFLLHYVFTVSASIALVVHSIFKQSYLTSMFAFLLLGIGWVAPTIANREWLLYRDVYLHGYPIMASDIHFQSIGLQGEWPFSYYAWLMVSRLLGLDAVDSSLVMLLVDWSLRLLLIVLICIKVVENMKLNKGFAWILSIFVFSLLQNHMFLLISYCRANLAHTFFLLLILIMLGYNFREHTFRKDLIVLLLVMIAVIFTHPFYITQFTVFIALYWLSGWLIRGNREHTISFRFVLLSFAIYTAYMVFYAVYTLDIGLTQLVYGEPTSKLLRLESLTVQEELPLYGVVARQIFKLTIASVGLMALISLFKVRLAPTKLKALMLCQALSALGLFVPFMFIPGFEGRLIAHTMPGVGLLSGIMLLQVLIHSRKRLKVLMLLFLSTVIFTPYLLSYEHPVLGWALTPSVITSTRYIKYFSEGRVYLTSPLHIYLSYYGALGFIQTDTIIVGGPVFTISPDVVVVSDANVLFNSPYVKGYYVKGDSS